MTHSVKKKPIIGCGGYSDKKDKQAYNRGYRQKLKTAIRKGQYDMLPYCESTRHGGNWNFNKDGKVWLSEKRLREDPRLIGK